MSSKIKPQKCFKIHILDTGSALHRTQITLFFCELEKLVHTTFSSTAIRLQRKIKLALPEGYTLSIAEGLGRWKHFPLRNAFN